MLKLPIDDVLPEAMAKLREARSLVLVAEPGAGKTTRLPPAILRSGLLSADHPRVALLQPRRVAARAAAARIAEENGWELGREVGYIIRFERRVSRDTKLVVMTEGVLTRQLIEDPILEGIGCVVLDEFHERSLHTDLAMALLREVRQTVRPELMLVVMSATLEAQPVARFLEDCPVIHSVGRTFGVDVVYAGTTPRLELPSRIASVVSQIDAGDALVFLPGVGEINRTIEALEPIARRDDLLVVPLHGSLNGDEQLSALRPANRRKIVVATNIAETSLTIDGVTTVIDSGLARVPEFDPQRGMDRLELRRISRASAAQRAGRAGRTTPGKCVRLWSAMEDKGLPPFETPEVQRVDLTATTLALHAWGQTDPRQFGWYEPPDERMIAYAERLLEMLGATTGENGGRITEIGRSLLSLPVHPRLGRLMLAAVEIGLTREGAAIAALLSEKDIVARTGQGHPDTRGDSDLLMRLEMLDSGRGALDRGALRQVLQARDELARTVGASRPSAQGKRSVTGLLRLPLWAYPDRVCRRRSNDPGAAVMVGGSGVRLAPESIVRGHEFFLALDARQDQRNPSREAMVHIASGIDVEWLEEMFPQQIRSERRLEFDEQRQRVVSRGATRYRDLPLRQDTDAPVDPEQAGQVLAAALRPRVDEFFVDEPTMAWLARLELLRKHMPEQPWPKIDLTEVLADACQGKRSVDEIRRTPMVRLLESRLSYPMDRLLEQHAPESIPAATGNRIRLVYAPDSPPVMAVRLQEMFGVRETPRVAAGRVPVRLHLLGPNFRPVQITDDLHSFWSTTYFQVRKDLRVRYPKHAWPDDPLYAVPQAKGGRRQN